MGTTSGEKRPLDTSCIDENDHPISTRRRSKRVSLSPSSSTTSPPVISLTSSQHCGTPSPRKVNGHHGRSNLDATTDDEVEFLYTTPAPLLSQPQAIPLGGEQCISTLPSPETMEPPGGGNTSTELATTSDAATTVTKAVTTRQFSHRSSAYLQSLAEICHAILWDARWRVMVGRSSHRLFAWELGDDMGAVHALARRYLHPTELLGDHGEAKEGINDEGTMEGTILADNHFGGGEAAMTSSHLATIEEGSEADSEADLDRCLETYSRLYFRKGPWFRLDNVFSSYYLPKPKISINQYTSTGDDIQSSSAESVTQQEASEPIPVKKQNSPTKFFVPTSQRRVERGQNDSSTKRTTHDYIDQDYLNLLLEAAEVLLIDMKRLHRMGLVRSFDSEEECGKQVGKSQRYTSGILRQDEQRAVLARLGGHRKRKVPPPNSAGSSSTNTNATASTSTTTEASENLIWRQMCQQKAIMKSFSKRGDDKTTAHSHLLPVLKHVNQILMEKWATGIVLKASNVEYIPSAVLRAATRSVSEALRQLTTSYNLVDATCFRLREAPLQTLQRVSRLYLCATSGPGNMRADGINAWRTLPASHSMDLEQAPLRTNMVPQPGSHSWNGMAYPGRDWRLRLISCNFVKAHIPLPATMVNQSKKAQNLDDREPSDVICVFSSIRKFKTWELGVELRANVDYLLELNELLLYNGRKQARENKKNTEDDHSDSDEKGDITRRNDSNGTPDTTVDYLDLLTRAGRSKIVSGFLNAGGRECMKVSDELERDVSELLGTPIGDLPLSALVGMTSAEATLSPSQPREKTRLQNECERILGVVALTLIHVLEKRNDCASSSDIDILANRPWLRHMSWEGCMAYLLWDLIPILERRGYYLFAIKALEVLLFGMQLPKTSNSVIPSNLFEGASQFTASIARSFLSRRARGKAYERLIIDYTHLQRQNSAKFENPSDQKVEVIPKSVRKSPACPSPNDLITHLTKPLVRALAHTGQITFSAIRTLARRLKCPLSSSLKDVNVFETRELGHRFCNGTAQQEQEGSKYTDWTPLTDTTVANAMNSNDNPVGGRCSYIGFEDDEVKNLYAGSLNVEELAMEYYRKGILPAMFDESAVKGGWVGWHDEGGKIRALFRIMASDTLGMDWGGRGKVCQIRSIDDCTLFLTPYQGAPFDLHVGAELVGSASGDPTVSPRGIYNRKRSAIEEFLENLSHLQGEELANVVYDCINKRLMYATSINCIDPSLERDVSQVRTLSMVAAGFGGKMLAAIFRCFFFDYRHYSGGLPDLLLVRALYGASEDRSLNELVDLGDWVGETFSKEYQDAIKAQKIAQVFAEKDEEFLGCSKVGDSGGRSTNKWNAGRGSMGSNRNTSSEEYRRQDKKQLVMPERLSFTHNDRKIGVECMCVEVKSQNDRLDPRQEDWLNILDRFGNARVCKFEKQKRPKSSKNSNKENGSSSGNS